MNTGQVWSQHLRQLNWQELRLNHGQQRGDGGGSPFPACPPRTDPADYISCLRQGEPAPLQPFPSHSPNPTAQPHLWLTTAGLISVAEAWLPEPSSQLRRYSSICQKIYVKTVPVPANGNCSFLISYI